MGEKFLVILCSYNKFIPVPQFCLGSSRQIIAVCFSYYFHLLAKSKFVIYYHSTQTFVRISKIDEEEAFREISAERNIQNEKKCKKRR